MPAPDIQYFLDASQESLHIAGDVHGYFMHIEPRANDVIDTLDAGPLAGFLKRRFKVMTSLSMMGLSAERHYIEWRRQKPQYGLGASFWGYEDMSRQVERFVEEYASCMVDAGYDRVSDLSVLHADLKFQMLNAAHVLKRACVRGYSDFEGYRSELLDAGRAQADEIWDGIRARRERALEELRDHLRYLGADDNGRNPHIDSDSLTVKRAKKLIRVGQQKQRRAVNRSIRFAQRFLGEEPTRLFIGGEKLRIEGKHVDFELVRTGSMSSSHGGAQMRLFSKGTDIQLCNLCIYTPGVPIMDHVASMVMHIQAGEEDRILEIGNLFNVKDAAYSVPWLHPRLPRRTKTRYEVLGVQILDEEDDWEDGGVPLGTSGHPKIPSIYQSPRYPIISLDERKERTNALKPALLEWIDGFVGRYMPPMPATYHFIRTGKVPYDAPFDWERAHRNEIQFHLSEEDARDPTKVALARAEIITAIRTVADNPALMHEYRQAQILEV